jgi:hypothetical protein
MGKYLDLTGQQYGRLTVLYRDPYVINETMWVCRCVCGKLSKVQSYDLRRNDYPTRSCGCLKKNIGRYRKKRISIEKFREKAKLKLGNNNYKKGPQTVEQKQANAIACKREFVAHHHYENLVNKPRQTLKILILYSNQQKIGIIMEDIKNIEEVQIPLGTHKYSTITLRKPGKPGLLVYNVIETRKEIMDLKRCFGQ